MSRFKQLLARFSESGNQLQASKKKIFLSIFASMLIVGAIIAIATNSKNSDVSHPHTHTVIKHSCSNTFYPGLCFSAITTANRTKKITSHKDVIEASLDLTSTAVKKNYFNVLKLLKKDLSERQKIALHDCMETIDLTIDDLHKAVADLQEYPNSKSLTQHAEDLKTMIGAAMTNTETCLDGFSHENADKLVRKTLETGQVHVDHMCSNALAMITDMTDTDIANELKALGKTNRKLKEEQIVEGDVEWPTWMSVGDRRLLQSTSVTPNVVVAADGSGNYRTISEAVARAPEDSSTRYIIRIKAGVYRENVEVPKKKTNIMFLGDGRTTTIITGDRNVVDGSTTFNSATVAVVGEHFLAREITFMNSAGPSKHQAVALRVGSDRSAFYRCSMLAYQDTLYVHTNRQFYISCFITGTVDFIFGNAAAVFQNCDILARRPNPGQKNMVTAQGRTDPNQITGIVIQKSRIGALSDLRPVQSRFPTYLGRPWKEYSRTVIMQSVISDVIHPAGWFEWSGDFALDTLYYGEYQNTGAGAGTSGRVNWGGFKLITSASEAREFTAARFIGGDSWLRATGFPFLLGL